MKPEQWKQHAQAIRKAFLGMHFRAKAGHIGSGLSTIDLLTYVYSGWLRREGTTLLDRFLLSKGHGASALYATLHHFGFLTDADLATYYQDGTLLPAHPAPAAWPAIPAATGSLGHGLSIAAGLALSAQRWPNADSRDRRVVCLLSDGECDEGSVWEASLFVNHHRLNNLVAVIDANGLQGFGRTGDVLNLEPLAEKFTSFGYDVIEIDGHTFKDIDRAFKRASQNTESGKTPTVILARTVKGKGVRAMENKLEWHYLPMDEAQYQQALKDVEEAG